MKKFIYQDPRRPRVKSRPIDESDVKARQILEGSGWRVVETIDDAEPTPAGDAAETPADPAAKAEAPKKGKGKADPAAKAEAPTAPEA